MNCYNCTHLSKNTDGLNGYSKEHFKANPDMYTCKGKGKFNNSWLFGMGPYHSGEMMCGGTDFEPKVKQLELIF